MSNHTKEPWSIGCLLPSPSVRDWSVEKREQADNEERTMIFSHFYAGDWGKSRKFIAKCVDEERARQIVKEHNEIAQLRADRAVLFDAYKELVYECLNDFVHIPEHRMTAEEYYSEELALIKRMEAWE